MHIEVVSNPWPKQRRPRGVRGDGLRFQEAVARHLSDRYPCETDLWLRYGRRHRSPDVCVRLPDAWVVVECKRTWIDAWSQIDEYVELVGELWGRPTFGLLVVKNLVPGFEGNLVSSVEAALTTERATWALSLV